MPVANDLYYWAYHQDLKDKPAVVLIHGAGGNHLFFPPKIRRLEGVRVFALDLPGHGKSGGVGRQMITAYAQAVVGWMDAVKMSKAVFAGHSMGGAIAMTLAKDYKDRVLGLCLIDTGAKLRVAKAILENSEHDATFPLAVSLLLSQAFGAHTPKRMADLAARRLLEVRPTVLHADMVACNAFDIRDALPALQVPALVICGEEDKLTPLRYSQYLADKLPQAELAVIPRAGHMAMLENSDEVGRVMTAYCRALDYAAGA